MCCYKDDPDKNAAERWPPNEGNDEARYAAAYVRSEDEDPPFPKPTCWVVSGEDEREAQQGRDLFEFRIEGL